MMSDNIELPKTLVYVCDSDPGITRKRYGRGFSYFDASGKRLKSKDAIQRIKALVIPPAWREVWICTKDNGYLQATGRDNKKRKQYRYHPAWEVFSSNNKFTHMAEFADQLPALRKRYNKDLRRDEWDREKVLALATALIDELFLRIGNKYYTQENKTYGLTTLRKKHVDFDGKEAHISFIGKKGSEREVDLHDKKLTKLLKECSELPGYQLFKYKDGTNYHNIDSSDFNAYINAHLNLAVHVSAKDFRTWGGTVLCVELEKQAQAIIDESPRKKKETTLIRLVANELGNTLAVCRKYYIHPAILDYCVKNTGFSPSKKSQEKYAEYEPDEQMVLEILNG